MPYVILITAIWFIAAWVNHLLVCFNEEAWGFLIAGAIFFPIGIFHGTWSWF